MLSIDKIMAIYLRYVAERVNAEFYATVLKFIILYRDCLNFYGWRKRAEGELRELKEHLEEIRINARIESFRPQREKFEYTEVNNGEFVPEICNEFVTVYYDEKQLMLKLNLQSAIDLTLNFCHWLYSNGHTSSQLSKAPI